MIIKSFKIITSLVFALVPAAAIASFTGFNVFAVLGSLFAFSLVPTPSGALFGKFILADFISDIRGNVGGTTYSRNRYGFYRKPLVIPINPNSVKQQNTRAYFGDISRKWRGLTSSQMQGWFNLAASCQFSKNGHSYFLPASVLFAQLNAYLTAIGEATISDAPFVQSAPTAVASFDVVTVATPGAEDIRLYISPAIATNEKVIVYGTPVFSNGIKNVPMDKMRMLGYLSHTFISGQSIISEYRNVFGVTPTATKRTAFAIRKIEKATGFDGMLHTCISTAVI